GPLQESPLEPVQEHGKLLIVAGQQLVAGASKFVEGRIEAGGFSRMAMPELAELDPYPCAGLARTEDDQVRKQRIRCRIFLQALQQVAERIVLVAEQPERGLLRAVIRDRSG